MMHDSRVRTWLLFTSGFLVPLIVLLTVGWWLDSGLGVAAAATTLAALGLIAALGRPDRIWADAVALSIGAVAGSAAVLFWRGPGTIWPIVLIFAAIISAGAVLAGAVFAHMARRLIRPAGR